MRVLKLGEFGKQLVFNSGIDISEAESYTVEFLKPSGTLVTLPTELGTADATGKDINGLTVTYLANQYTFMTIPEGLLDETGCWAFRTLNPTLNTEIPGDYNEFHVINA